MAFVNEVISDVDKAQLDPQVFYDPRYPPDGYWKRKFNPYRWAIDRDRDIFIVRLGGRLNWEGEGTPRPRQHFALSFRGQVIRFEATFREDAPNSCLVGYWVVHEIPLSSDQEGWQIELQGIVQDALAAYGDFTGNNEVLKELHIVFEKQTVE